MCLSKSTVIVLILALIKVLFFHSFGKLHGKQIAAVASRATAGDGETIGAGIVKKESPLALGTSRLAFGHLQATWKVERDWVNLLDCGPRRAAEDRKKLTMFAGDSTEKSIGYA